MTSIPVEAKLTGDAELNALFHLLPAKLQIYALQPAVTTATRTIAASEKPLAPELSGLLKQSVGIGKIVANPSTGSVRGAAGPRKGYVVTTKSGKITFTTSRKRAAKGGGSKSGATRYAHLTESDHKTKSGGTVQGTHWMARGFDAVKDRVQSQMQSDIAAGILKQASRLGK